LRWAYDIAATVGSIGRYLQNRKISRAAAKL